MDFMQRTSGVLLIGGGSVKTSVITGLLEQSLDVFCADGGYRNAKIVNVVPIAVLGDFDSVSEATVRGDGVHAVELPDQDQTDFEKSLNALSAPFYFCVGFLGGRMDHSLSAFNVLARMRDKRVFLIGETSFAFLCPDELQLDLPKDTSIGVMPMEESRAVSTGLAWELDGIAFSPVGRTSSSNKVSGPLDIKVTAGRFLVTLPLDVLDSVLSQLLKS